MRGKLPGNFKTFLMKLFSHSARKRRLFEKATLKSFYLSVYYIERGMPHPPSMPGICQARAHDGLDIYLPHANIGGNTMPGKRKQADA